MLPFGATWRKVLTGEWTGARVEVYLRFSGETMIDPKENTDEREPNTSAVREPNTRTEEDASSFDSAQSMADDREPNTLSEPTTEN
jgi:hypothetical protein